MPRHPNPTLYTYQLINVPVQVMYLGPGKLVKVTCDWMGHFAQHLQKGWKLTDIFWDQGKRSHGGINFIIYAHHFFSDQHAINSCLVDVLVEVNKGFTGWGYWPHSHAPTPNLDD